MKHRKILIFLILLSTSFQLFSQEVEEVDPMPIRLKGQVLNLDDELPVPFATILNYRTHGTVSADDQGRFTMDMMNIDSLAISSLGFSKSTVHIPANYNEMNVLKLYAKPIRFAIPEVKVTGEKFKVEGLPTGKKSKIDPQLRGDAYDKKPPLLAALVTPLSFIQYYTSKREKEKRETRQAIVTEKKWEILSQFYNKKLVMELTGLNDPQADIFMTWFNSKNLLSHMSTDYDVRAAIVEQFKIYQNEGH
ncbi:MAG TPA: hypothetical protein VF373_08260 [Prolixibacteraceae bacterium]